MDLFAKKPTQADLDFQAYQQAENEKLAKAKAIESVKEFSTTKGYETR